MSFLARIFGNSKATGKPEASASALPPESPSSAAQSSWYVATSQKLPLTQVVIELPTGAEKPSRFATLLLGDKYMDLVTGTWITGLFRMETDPGPFLLVRADGHLDEVVAAPLKVGFSFYRAPSGGIVGLYIYIDSESLRVSGGRPHAFMEFGYGLDQEDTVGRIRDAFRRDTLDVIFADGSNSTTVFLDPSTRRRQTVATPCCRYDISYSIDQKCREALLRELDALLQYHRSLPAGRKNFQTSMNEMWAALPMTENPILARGR